MDQSHHSLLRFYSGCAVPVAIGRYENLDIIVKTSTENKEIQDLVDLAEKTHTTLVKRLDKSEAIKIEDEWRISIHYWYVMDFGKDSVNLLKKLLDRFDPRFSYGLVLNHIHGDRFDILSVIEK